MLVSAPLAHQRKLVEGADKSTTHHAKTDSRLDSLPLPAPAEQTQRAEAGREEWESAREWSRMRRWQCEHHQTSAHGQQEDSAQGSQQKFHEGNRFQSRGATIPYGQIPKA